MQDNSNGRNDMDALIFFELFESRQILQDTLDKLYEINSSFAATQEFLRSRGLTSVAGLDEAGRRELMLYLKNKLREMLTRQFLATHGVTRREELTDAKRAELDNVLSKILSAF